MISLHVVVDNASPEVLDRSLAYLKTTKQPFVNIAGGSQIDRAMQFVERCQIEIPSIQVFWRVLEDTGNVITMDDNQWWNERILPRLGWMKEHHVIMVVDNESSGDSDLIKKYVTKSITRMNMLHDNGLYGAFCRFATGNIQEHQYVFLKPLLDVLDAKDWISPNEYSNSPGKSSAGHLERYKRILNIVPNKTFNVSIGECGILKDYQANEGYTTIPISGKDAAAQLIADEIWYRGGIIPRFWFVRGGYDNWKNVQVGNDALEFLEDYYAKNPIPQPIDNPPAPPPVITPPYTPDPFTSGMRYQVTVPADFINVRAAPSTIAAKLGEVPNKAVVTVFEETLENGEYWRRITFGTISGWVSLQKGAVKFAPYLPDSPSTINIPIDLLKDIQSSLKNNISNLSRDLEMVNQILEKVGGDV